MIEYHRTNHSMHWNQYKYNVHEQYKSNSFIGLYCIVSWRKNLLHATIVAKCMHWRTACGITWRYVSFPLLPITNVITVPKLLQPDRANGIMKKNVKAWIQKKHIHVRIVERNMTPETVCGIMHKSVHKRQQPALQLCLIWRWKLLPSKALKNWTIQLHPCHPHCPQHPHPRHQPNSTWWK